MIKLAIKKYKKRNQIIKYCLFLFILILSSLLYYLSKTTSNGKFIVQSAKNNQIQEENNLDISKVKYYSNVNKSNYFEIKADNILQKNKTQYQLSDIIANLKFKQNLSLKAKDGILDIVDKLLKLKSVAQFTLDDRYDGTVQSVELNLEENTLTSSEKIQITSVDWELIASGFKYWQDKAIVNFVGPISLKIKQTI